MTSPTLTSRRIIGLLLGGIALLLLGLGGIIWLAADRTPPLTPERLAAAETLWKAAGLADYDLEIDVEGTRAGKILVRVRGGEVVSMTRDGRPPTRRELAEVWAIPGLFTTLQQELDLVTRPERAFATTGPDSVDARALFDPQRGYPVRYQRFVPGTPHDLGWRTRLTIPTSGASPPD